MRKNTHFGDKRFAGILQFIVKKILTTHWLLWSVLALTLALRLPHLTGSFWLDEAAQALESSRPLSQQFMIKEDFQPPLLHLIVHVLVQISRAEWWLRLSPLSDGLGMVLFTFLIAKRFTSTKIALFSTLLLSFNSFHIYYSQELRPYALTGFWVAFGWWLILKITDHTIIKPKLLIGFIICSVAGMYSTYLYPFAFIGQLIYLITRRSKHFVVQTVIASVVTTLTFLPWLPFLKEQITVSSQLRTTTPNWETVVSTPQLKALQLVFGKFLFGVVNLDLNPTFITISLAFIALTLFLLWELRKRIGVNTYFMISCWFILPVFSIWIFSFLLPVLQPKRVLFALPAFELLLATLIIYGWNWKKTRLAAVSLGAVLIATHLFGTFSYYFNPQYQRENWRSIIYSIDTQYSKTNTAIVFGFDHPFSPWDWYTHQAFPTITTGTATKTQYEQIEPVMTKALDYQNVIVFDYLTDLTDPNHYTTLYLEKYNYKQGQLFEDPNLGFVRVFTKGGSFAKNTQRYD